MMPSPPIPPVLPVVWLFNHFNPPQEGSTSLMMAAREGNYSTAALLLDRGADKEAKDKVSVIIK